MLRVRGQLSLLGDSSGGWWVTYVFLLVGEEIVVPKGGPGGRGEVSCMYLGLGEFDGKRGYREREQNKKLTTPEFPRR